MIEYIIYKYKMSAEKSLVDAIAASSEALQEK